MFFKRKKWMWILYVVFAAYVSVVIFFILSMLLRSAGITLLKKKGEGLPQYMNADQMKQVEVQKDGSLNQQLQSAFQKADSNVNSYLEEDELSDWIQSKISEHITVAVKGNIGVFLQLDIKPKDGWISSSEYESFFLSSRGVGAESELSRPMRDQLSRERAEFEEAASSPGQLTIDELLSFRHPESSHSRLLDTVNELVETLDDDGDLELSKSELLTLTSEGYMPSESEAMFVADSPEDLAQLHTQLDLNDDGQLNQHELLVFVDPRHRQHSAQDAARLVAQADTDKDGRLSLPEVQQHQDKFRLIVDARHKFHQLEDLR